MPSSQRTVELFKSHTNTKSYNTHSARVGTNLRILRNVVARTTLVNTVWAMFLKNDVLDMSEHTLLCCGLARSKDEILMKLKDH